MTTTTQTSTPNDNQLKQFKTTLYPHSNKNIYVEKQQLLGGELDRTTKTP